MINGTILKAIQTAHKYPIITRVGVFGSYARGEQTKNSDLDILYDYASIDEETVLEILNYYKDIEKELSRINLQFDYISYPGIMESKNSKVKSNILKDVVWIYEKVG